MNESHSELLGPDRPDAEGPIRQKQLQQTTNQQHGKTPVGYHSGFNEEASGLDTDAAFRKERTTADGVHRGTQEAGGWGRASTSKQRPDRIKA